MEKLKGGIKKRFCPQVGHCIEGTSGIAELSKILAGSNYITIESPVMKECNELVSILVRSVETNKRKMEEERQRP